MKRVLVMILAAWTLQGCGVYMAFTQPDEVDLSLFEQPGMPRDLVIEKLGAPKSSTSNQDGTKTDIYEFYEGSHTGWKVGRGLFHLGADIVSLALWEIVATPMEYGIRGEKLTAKAEFDKQEHLKQWTMLTKPKPKPDNVEIDDY